MTIFWRLTRSPESRAASSLPPMAYIERPMNVRPRISAVIRPIAIITRTGTGSQPPSVSPSRETDSGKAIGLPCEMTSERPRAMESIANVAMNGGSLPYEMSAPFTKPQAMPVTIARTTARTTGTPADVADQARTVADRAATEPTDRSMPAETMTKVTPNARMAVTAAWTPTFSRFWVVRKSPESSDIATTRTTRALSAPLSSRTRRITEVPLCPCHS